MDADGSSAQVSMRQGAQAETFYPKTLVLNATFHPINICSWRRAMTLLFKQRAVPVVESQKLINGRYPAPLVVRLSRYAPVPHIHVVLTRKNVYLRDNTTCQYCGKNSGSMTIDHVVPRSKGGKDSWDNIVVACVRCNNRKGDHAPQEMGMTLMRQPFRPPSSLYLQITRLGNAPESWSHYFFRREGERRGR